MDAPETFPRYRIDPQTGRLSRVLRTMYPGGEEVQSFCGPHDAAITHAETLRAYGFVAWSGDAPTTEPAATPGPDRNAPELAALFAALVSVEDAAVAAENQAIHAQAVAQAADEAFREADALSKRLCGDRRAAADALAAAVFAPLPPNENGARLVATRGDRRAVYDLARTKGPHYTVKRKRNTVFLALFALALFGGCECRVSVHSAPSTTHRTASPGAAAPADVADPGGERLPPIDVPVLAR